MLENIETCSADNSLIPLLVSRYAPSLAYLRLGSRCPDCDWGINLRFRENPYGTVMPFGGSEIVQICRAACLRAKRSLSQGKFQEGLDDLMASLILARRLGQSGITFGKSLQAWLEKQAIQVSGSYLSSIPKTTILREFESKISTLPPTPSLSSLVLKEK